MGHETKLALSERAEGGNSEMVENISEIKMKLRCYLFPLK